MSGILSIFGCWVTVVYDFISRFGIDSIPDSVLMSDSVLCASIIMQVDCIVLLGNITPLCSILCPSVLSVTLSWVSLVSGFVTML